MTRQRHATPVAFDDVTIDDDFWGPYVERVREEMLDYQYEQLEESGVLENFRAAAGESDADFENMWFADSDAYKWLEAASYVLAVEDDPDLRAKVEEVIDLVAAAQHEDGYLNTWITLEYPGRRWTNLTMGHELYCAGHLVEAAVAHHRATGEDDLLEVAIDLADRVDDVFGPDGRNGTPGHEEIELALARLYRVTGEERYLDLASFFVERRGKGDLEAEFEDTEERAGTEGMWEGARSALFEDDEYDGTYAQDHAPVREQDTVEGHSVRATYCYTALADLVLERGEEGLFETMEDLWANMTERRMYVTGGIGSTHLGERFTEDYHLPNRTSYAETCASIGDVFWNHRLFQLTGEARFPELIERTLYNAFLAGISPDLTEFFYANPHEVGPGGHELEEEDPTRFANQRQGWFECACCPPNAARLLASLGQYLYATAEGDSTVYVRQFVGSEVSTTVEGTDVTLRQDSALPWEGDVTIEVDPEEAVAFDLRARIPEWATDVSATLDDEDLAVEADAAYVAVDRTWEPGDALSLSFEMEPEVLVAHPAVEADRGKVALRRGPIVYCLEGVDHDRPLGHYAIPDDGEIEAPHREDLLGGVTTLDGEATVPEMDGWEGELYRRADAVERESTEFTAVPYYAWANREPGEMRVWIERE